MAFDFLTAGLELITKIIPEAGAKEAAKLELLKLHQSGELAVMASDERLKLGQMEVNKAEATNPSLFVSGWRPATGWVCVVGLLYTFLLRPMMSWWALTHELQVPPALDTFELMGLLGGMLGLGGMRMNEKKAGVASK